MKLARLAVLALLVPPALGNSPASAQPGAAAPRSGGEFYLKNGDRVVFYGDSITDQRLYTTFVESYAVTRFPGWNLSFVHSGWGGDRVTGGGGGRIGRRLHRDVLAYNPTVVTIMLGMNDGSYRSFDEKVFDTYANGYRHLVEELKDFLPGVRLTLIQPSPYDDVNFEPRFEGGYNAVLVRYGEFIKELAQKENVDVADLNTSVVEALKKAKESDPDVAKKIVPDRVHPGPAGHLLMAAALLKAWHAPATVSTVEIDAPGGKITRQENTHVSELGISKGLIWNQADNALPMPIDLKDPVIALAVRSSDLVDSLDRQMLKVSGLPTSEYRLKIDGEDVGTFGKDQLAEGINLATLPTPMAKQAAEVHRLTKKHTDIHQVRWRGVQVPLQNESSSNAAAALRALDELEAEYILRQRSAAQPVPRRYELVPAM
jgi:lysophospholipase L1-like esterase